MGFQHYYPEKIMMSFPGLLGKEIYPELKERNSKCKKEICKIMTRNARCCWYKCSKNIKDGITILFKVCSGCSMSYYCSKSCQKKAWKYGHKEICKTLRRRLL